MKLADLTQTLTRFLKDLHNLNQLSKISSKTSFSHLTHLTLHWYQKPYVGWPIWPLNQTSKPLTQHAENILSMLNTDTWLLSKDLNKQNWLKWSGFQHYKSLLYWLLIDQRLKTIDFKWPFKLSSENRLLTKCNNKADSCLTFEYALNFDQDEFWY